MPVLFALPFAAICCHTLQNNDLPMHLAIGEWILDHGRIPDRDPFSALTADRPWVPHEWLAGVLFALVDRLAGPTGLLVLTVVLGTLLAGVHARVMRALGVSPAALLVTAPALAVLVGHRLMLRPHLPALALEFVIWGVLLAGRQRPRLLWLLPPTLILWVNLHGSYYIGLVTALAGLVLLPGVLRLEPGGLGGGLGSWPTAGAARVRGAVAVACVLALLVQPHGLGLLAHPFRLTGESVFMRTVQEWTPPFGSEPGSALFRATPAFALFVAMLPLAILGVWWRRRRLPLVYLLFVAATLVLALRHQRYTALFGLAAVPLLPWAAWQPRQAGARLALAVVPVVAALLLLVPGYPATWSSVRGAPRAGGMHLWAANLPLWEVDLLRRHGYSGPVVCEYTYGGVVAWRGRGALKPTMDSRNTVYGAERYLAHQRGLIAGDPPLLDQAVAVLVSAPWRAGPGNDRLALHRRLEDDPRWLLASFTLETFLYVQAGAGGLDERAFRHVRPATGRVRVEQLERISPLLKEARLAIGFPYPPTPCLVAHAKSWIIAWRMAENDETRELARREALASIERLRAREDPWARVELAELEDWLAKPIDPAGPEDREVKGDEGQPGEEPPGTP